MSLTSAARPGRRPSTDRAAIESVAFRLFEEHGFHQTTTDQIAEAVGVGRRTLFRYFSSKNDILWGQFDESLRHFRAQFAALPSGMPLADAVHRCVVKFNEFDEASLPQHRVRMTLILSTPALQAHSALRYRAWRDVISDYVGKRMNLPPEAIAPTLVGHVALALAVTSYEQWLADPDLHLTELLDDAMVELRAFAGSSTA